MREGNARSLARLAMVAILLLAVSVPADSGGFVSWLRRVLGKRYEYVSKMTRLRRAGPTGSVVSPIDSGRLMVFNLGTVTASPLPGTPAACWSPVAVNDTEIAFLSGSGQYADQHDAGLWVYFPASRDSYLIMPASALPAGTGFYAIAEPPEGKKDALIVVLRRVQAPTETLYRIANLATGQLEEIPDAPNEPGDAAGSHGVADLLVGSRIRQGRIVSAGRTGSGLRELTVAPAPDAGPRAVDYELVVRSALGRKTDNFDPHWLNDNEILYVTKPG